MNKYNLIHTITGEKHFCNKVVIDGNEYYVTSTDNTQTGDWVYSEDLDSIEKVKELFTCLMTEHETNVPAAKLENFNGFVELPRCKKVIATSNPDILIPCILDVIENDAERSYFNYIKNDSRASDDIKSNDCVTAYKNGYFKSFVTQPFSIQDMIAFANYVRILDTVTASAALPSWIEQKPTTLYYE